MSRNWIPRIARGCTEWLRLPQPRAGTFADGDADGRRLHNDLAAVRARFSDHA